MIVGYGGEGWERGALQWLALDIGAGLKSSGGRVLETRGTERLVGEE